MVEFRPACSQNVQPRHRFLRGFHIRYPERPISTFLAAVLVLIPLPWHWRARNIATVSLITWLFVVNVIYGINSIIWAGNVRNIVPTWCDITTKIVVGASYALPTSTMCICKHLEAVSSTHKIAFDHFGRIRIAFESVMCFGVPVLLMGLHFIVQGHRFDIVENMGCQAAVYVSLPAVFIIWVPPLSFSFATMIYAILALNNFIQRRMIFASHIQKSDSALTPNRYLRLTSMAVTIMVYATFCACYTLYNNVSAGLAPWTTWDDVHADWLRVNAWPEFLIPPGVLNSILIIWWAMPVSAFIFFLFFGFGEEAVKANLKAYRFVMHAILRKRSSEKNHVQVLVESNVGQPLLCTEPRSNLTSQRPSTCDPTNGSPSRPSRSTLVTPVSGHVADQALSSETGLDATTIHNSTVSSTSSFSACAQLRDQDTYRGSTYRSYAPLPQISNEPPRLPEIPRSASLSSPGSPVSSLPDSIEVVFYQSPQLPGCPPSPVYHRPFSGPTICPVTQDSDAQQGLPVTVERHKEFF